MSIKLSQACKNSCCDPVLCLNSNADGADRIARLLVQRGVPFVAGGGCFAGSGALSVLKCDNCGDEQPQRVSDQLGKEACADDRCVVLFALAHGVTTRADHGFWDQLPQRKLPLRVRQGIKTGEPFVFPGSASRQGFKESILTNTKMLVGSAPLDSESEIDVVDDCSQSLSGSEASDDEDSSSSINFGA